MTHSPPPGGWSRRKVLQALGLAKPEEAADHARDIDQGQKPPLGWTRRRVLQVLGVSSAAAAGAGAVAGATTTGESEEPGVFADAVAGFFQDHYKRMDESEIENTLQRLQRKYKRKYNTHINIDNTPPQDGVVFGYALNISRCKGYRDCVEACVKENNLSRDSEIHYIRVLEMDNGTMDLEKADHYYDHEQVPQPGKYYLPVQCHQCENPPCVTACPVEATWMEPDGLVVVDYDWCIGCRFCATACPYWARKFNWKEPEIPEDEINTDTHFLSNRPREAGVIEKCTFCLQRSRKGRMPACQEACPTGARAFGNILDPASEIRYILENKKVFRLKEDLNLEPKFWYYSD